MDQVITHIAHLAIRFQLDEPMWVLKGFSVRNPLSVGLQSSRQLWRSDRRKRWGVDLQVVGENEAGHGLWSVKKTLMGLGHPR